MQRWRGIVAALASALGCVDGSQPAAAADAPFRLLHIERTPVRWKPQNPGDVRLISYAVANRRLATLDAVNCRGMQAPNALLARSAISRSQFRAAVDDAFTRWQRVANIAFVEIEDIDAADIVIGEQSVPLGRAFTNVSLAADDGTPYRPIAKSLICLNPDARWKVGYDGNLAVYDLVHTLTHEIGHAIGLDHPGPRGQIMSFRYDESHTGLSEGDVLGAVRVYGSRTFGEAERLLASQRGSPGDGSGARHVGRAFGDGRAAGEARRSR